MKYIRCFDEISYDDIPLVGGKNASLGEMYRKLVPLGVRIPHGFAVTAEAYCLMLDQSGTWAALHAALDGLDIHDTEALAKSGRMAREAVYAATIPDDVRREILKAYQRLQEQCGGSLSLAVRSSATAEDLPDASFAGQQDTYLNIQGEESLLDACHHCFASLFTDRAIHYRMQHGFDHFKVYLSVAVMQMVRSDMATSGVMFTLDTESGFRDVVFITAAYGLGENVVQGAVEPDEFYVHKPTFKQGYRRVLYRRQGMKKIKMVYASGRTGQQTQNIPTTQQESDSYCMTDAEVLKLADDAITIETYYSHRAGHAVPMDIEWAKDGLDGQIYIVQARPETVESQQHNAMLERYILKGTGEVIVSGRAVGMRVGSGRVRVIHHASELNTFQQGDVLVSDLTTPDWEPVMKLASGIVTNRGGRTCHAAIVARELGIPAIVGCADATQRLNNQDMVTVACCEGDVGHVYHGDIPFEMMRTDMTSTARPSTQMMVNLANPELAFATSFLPCDGVGLARMEFIINEHIGVHPMALLHLDQVNDAQERKKIEHLMRLHASGADYFIERLSEGVGMIAAAFWPRPVVVRMSDFKSNEYASLLGGQSFESFEANPMIGFRGASRYIHPAYREAFALECQAMKRVREDMGLSNVRLMIPFCRRVEEGEQVLQVMAEHGLRRGEYGLEIYVMCEIPNNVIQLDAFAQLFDGFSIGSNDLTQLTLGVDRDSELVAGDFDERDAGVLMMIRMAVEGAKRNGCHIGICGQAPSDYPEMAVALVEMGIDSMSLTPDSLMMVSERVLQAERALQASKPHCGG
ncbi:phosphoenolpyruvate synthase [Mariprofundus ferrooxydans]|nr:phosphoenolpyruvate synthase [Mariprofundus ferrooxydans]